MLPLLDPILRIVDKFIPDGGKAAELKLEVEKVLLEQGKLQADLIRNEQQSDSWMARNWRPMFAIMIMVMILGHWLLYDVFHFAVVTLDWNIYTPQDPGLDPQLWETIRLCLTGFIGARSVEKVAKTWKK